MFGRPLGHPLEGGDKTQDREKRPKYPHRQVERTYGEHDSRASGELENGARFSAFARSETRNAGYIARPLGDFQPFECRLRTPARLHTTNIADKPHQILPLLPFSTP